MYKKEVHKKNMKKESHKKKGKPQKNIINHNSPVADTLKAK